LKFQSGPAVSGCVFAAESHARATIWFDPGASSTRASQKRQAQRERSPSSSAIVQLAPPSTETSTRSIVRPPPANA
jgi:hypothetical protein